MERKNLILPLSIVFLGISILMSGYWISRSIEIGLNSNSNGLSSLGVSLGNAMAKPNDPGTKYANKEILSSSEAQEFLGMSTSNFYNVMDDIPHVVAGNNYVYSKRALIDWVEHSNYRKVGQN